LLGGPIFLALPAKEYFSRRPCGSSAGRGPGYRPRLLHFTASSPIRHHGFAAGRIFYLNFYPSLQLRVLSRRYIPCSIRLWVARAGGLRAILPAGHAGSIPVIRSHSYLTKDIFGI
jgi:hypothetical protein